MYFWPLISCLVIAAASPRLWVPALRRWGAVDVPNGRSSHRHPTIRGAGLAPASGVLVGLVVALLLVDQRSGLLLTTLLVAALAIAALGLAEDLRGLSIAVRALAQLGLGLLVGVALTILLDQPLGWAPAIALAVAAYVNAANFMDGVDGMSALHGLVAGTYYIVLGIRLDEPWITLTGGLTAAAFAGFAPWNLLRGRVFLGDVGSYLLGALVVLCGAGVFLSGAPVLAAVAPALPYLADTGITIIRRVRRGERVFEAHRSHVYQRLTDGGRSHLTSAASVAGASMICCIAAVVGMASPSALVGATVVVVLVLATYLTAPRWAVSARNKVSA